MEQVVEERTAVVLDAVKAAILSGLEKQGFVTPATEVRVQRAVDRLRAEPDAPAALSQVESLSCMLRRMHGARLQGRINAYDSALVRLRKAAEAL